MFTNSINVLKNYIGTGLIFALFIAAFIYLAIEEEDKIKRLLLVWLPAVVFAIFLLPPFGFIFDRIAGGETYFRILWMLPVSIEVAYAMIKLLGEASGRKRLILLLSFCVLIATCGTINYRALYYGKAENLYQVPETVVTICDMIEYPGREVKALFPYEFVTYVRQYSARVVLAVGRDAAYEESIDPLAWYMLHDSYEAEKLAELCRRALCHFVIIHESKEIKGKLEDYGYKVLDVVNGYTVFQDATLPLEY